MHPLYYNSACNSVTGKQKGLSYVEVLVASFIIAIALLPAIEALGPGIQGADIHQDSTVNYFHLIEKLEQVLAEPFTALESAAGSPTTASSYSDVITASDGRMLSRLVNIAGYDADNLDADNNTFTGADPGLLWIQVSIEDTMLSVQTVTRQ